MRFLSPPPSEERRKGREIELWMEESGADVVSYVIFDDEPSEILPHQMERYVETAEGACDIADPQRPIAYYPNGLEQKHYDLALEILSRKIEGPTRRPPPPPSGTTGRAR